LFITVAERISVPKRTARKQTYRWRILRIRGTPAVYIGTVEAPDAASAIKQAIDQI